MNQPPNTSPTKLSRTSGDLFRRIFDSLSAHVAILDRDGWILETNQSWKQFARHNHLKMRPDMVNINYLDVCTRSLTNGPSDVNHVLLGIRELIEKKNDEFVMEYPCHSPDIKRWFYMRATRLETAGELYIVVSHEDISPLKQIQENLLGKERMLLAEQEKLNVRSSQLEEANTALKVLLEQRDRDRSAMEKRVHRHIGELVLPHLDELLTCGLDPRQLALAETIRTSLNNITAPFLKRISSLELKLTPLEIRVANLVKEGRTTKEIALILASSTDAVDFHRKNIRKKMGLTGQGINLRTFLLSLK